MLEDETHKIIQGDSRVVLDTLPDSLVDTVITSPPYYGLRDYHNGDDEIGREDSPEEYVSALTELFRKVRRVLKPTGTLWLNLGDVYINKQLLGIPWRVAFSLQSDGWILRSDIIWAKPNPMPQSVKDRCTSSHEYLFMFSKVPQGYYFDIDAIEEPANYDGRKDTVLKGSTKYGQEEIVPGQSIQSMAARPHERWRWKTNIKFGGSKYPESECGTDQTYSGNEWTPKYKNLEYEENGRTNHTFHERRALGLQDEVYAVRRKRDVWTIPTKGYEGAHFATFPEKLVEPCILAGCPKDGIVMDVFSGAGTTGVVAINNNRKYIGIELNPQYVELSEKRIAEETAQMTFAF